MSLNGHNEAIFWMQILISFGVFSLISVWYVWPKLTKVSLNTALTPVLWVQVFRYVGMTLLVKGMIDARLDESFLSKAAYGDFLAAALALASILALRAKWRGAIALIWIANTWGFVDLLNGLRSVIQSHVATYHLATFWYIYIFYAPLVIVAHLMIFTMLLKARSWNEAGDRKDAMALD